MPTMETPPGPLTVVDGRQYLYFAGTGYLGLQGRPEVVRAACQAAERYGMGSATSRSRTGFGDTPPALLAEERAAEFFGCEAALHLPSGYLAPQALLRALHDTCDVILLDEHCHYAVSDAARILGKPVTTFRHRDPANLLEKLSVYAGDGRRPLVATDGVFPATGSLAPLADYHSILRAHSGAALLVDDSHGIGVLGERGRGLFEHAGLFNEDVNAHGAGAEITPAVPRVYLCASLAKAIGGYGGIIPGARRFIEQIKTRSPPYGGATPPPPPVAAATAEGLRIARGEPELRRRLHANTRALKAGLRRLGFDVDPGPAPIAALCLASADSMQRLQRGLADAGVLIAYLARYQGLPSPGALRIAVFAGHTEAMIARLLDELSLRRPMGAAVTLVPAARPHRQLRRPPLKIMR